MPTRFYTLQLEPYDDVASIRDRLTFLNARYVLLMWPDVGSVLRRKLDLLLVQRQATHFGIRIALVTGDPDIIENATDLNISVFADEQSARLGRWKYPRDKVFVPPRDPSAQAEIAEHIYRQRQPLTPLAFRWRQTMRWIMFGALLLALAGGLVLTAPSATVSLTPANRQVFETVSILADPDLTDIDIENYQMPASVITLQATSHVTIQTSGRESAGLSMAQGLVTISNTADSPILIPLGTIVSTSDQVPIRFETTVETILPAGNAASVQVPVQALPQHAGAVGNVNPGQINRIEADFADAVSVTNLNATYGGAAQEQGVVQAEDHSRLLVLGRQEVLQNARDELLLYLSGDQFLVPGSLKIILERPEWTVFSAYEGDRAESVSLDLRAEVQAVVVDEAQARQIAQSALAPYIEPGQQISPQALSFSRGDI
ncbi:MAG: baseplate J/gp47 family protein, partial [Alphaproteobacteria bacterium]